SVSLSCTSTWPPFSRWLPETKRSGAVTREPPLLSAASTLSYSEIAIIGAPLDLGQDRRGVDMGPSALRVANLNRCGAALGYKVQDLGNVPVEQPESLPEGPEHAKYLPQIAASCTRLRYGVQCAGASESPAGSGRRPFSRDRDGCWRGELVLV